MVYHGPSSGCLTCRRRKIKCDEGDPCQNCTRRGLPCPGLPSMQSSSRNGRRSWSTAWQPLGIQQTATLIDEGAHVEPPGANHQACDEEDVPIDEQAQSSCIDEETSESEVDSSEALVPPGSSPATSWKDVSVASYLTFVGADMGELSPWITMVLDANGRANRDCVYFNDALAAASLQRMGMKPHLRGLQHEAAAFHGIALRRLRAALSKADTVVTCDQTLLAIKLLMTYSHATSLDVQNTRRSSYAERASVSGSSDDSGTSGDEEAKTTFCMAFNKPLGRQVGNPIIHRHHDGLLQLLLARGPRQLHDEISNRLYLSIRESVIYNYAFRCQRLPVSKDQPSWQWFFTSPAADPGDMLTNIATDLPATRGRAHSLYCGRSRGFDYQEVQELKTDAYMLLARLHDWHAELPHDWAQPEIVPLQEFTEYPYFGRLYRTPLIAMTIGRYSAYSIMLLQVVSTCVMAEIEHCLVGSGTPPGSPLLQEHTASAARQQIIVDEICGILAVYSLCGETFLELGKPISACGLQHGGYIVASILTSKSVQSINATQRMYLDLKMKDLLGIPKRP